MRTVLKALLKSLPSLFLFILFSGNLNLASAQKLDQSLDGSTDNQSTSAGVSLEGKRVDQILPPNPGSSQLFFGQNHYYSITLRGNSETVVYARVVLNNPNEEPQTSFNFEIPKVEPYELVAFQQILPQVCSRYDYNNPLKSQVCAEYQDPDYNQPDYAYSNRSASYQKLKLDKSGQKFTTELHTDIQGFKSGAIILSYAAKGYVKESASLFTYNFETLKVKQRIQNLRVAVDVDSDLYLRGKRGEVNYNNAELGSLKAISSASNPTLDRAVSQIGSDGPIIKEASNLAPNESFLVKGNYAKSWFRLYLMPILMTMGLFTAVIISLLFGKKWLKRFRKEQPSSVGAVNTSEKHLATVNHPIATSLNILMSIFSVGAVLLLTFILTMTNLQDVINSFLYAGYYGSFVSIIWIVLLLLVYGLAIFGPAIFGAIKGGWKTFLFIMILELVWYLLLGVCLALFFQSGLIQPPNYYRGGVEPAVLGSPEGRSSTSIDILK